MGNCCFKKKNEPLLKIEKLIEFTNKRNQIHETNNICDNKTVNDNNKYLKTTR